MKTNHQRGFKETRDPNSVFRAYYVFSSGNELPLSDRYVGAVTTCGDHTNGKRGIAKDRRGAKKFINSRTRFHENQALKQMTRNSENLDD